MFLFYNASSNIDIYLGFSSDSNEHVMCIIIDVIRLAHWRMITVDMSAVSPTVNANYWLPILDNFRPMYYNHTYSSSDGRPILFPPRRLTGVNILSSIFLVPSGLLTPVMLGTRALYSILFHSRRPSRDR